MVFFQNSLQKKLKEISSRFFQDKYEKALKEAIAVSASRPNDMRARNLPCCGFSIYPRKLHFKSRGHL